MFYRVNSQTHILKEKFSPILLTLFYVNNKMDNDATICRTCLKFLKLGDGVPINDPNNCTVQFMIHHIIPAPNVNIVEEPTLCDECVIALRTMVDFKEKYNETMNKIESIVENSKVRVIEFSLKMENPNLEQLNFDDIFHLKEDGPCIGKQVHTCWKCSNDFSSFAQLITHMQDKHLFYVDEGNMADISDYDEMMEISTPPPSPQDEAATDGPIEVPAEEIIEELAEEFNPDIFFN